MKRKILITLVITCVSFALLNVSCSDDNDHTSVVNLSTTKVTAKIGETFSVDISLSQPDRISSIVVEKTISGKKVQAYSRTLNVSGMQFPYTFTEEVIPEDEEGIVVYSFYGLGANGNQIDASDIVVNINITQLYRLTKYDWKPVSQIIQKEDYAAEYTKDDVYRFNSDQSWELDWGTKFSDWGLETLDSYCAWKIVGTDEKIDSLYMIKYNIFAPTQAVITKYRVVKLQDQELTLESIQDLSGLGAEFSDKESVLDTYAGVSKSSDFTPYRGSNPDSYKVEACKPGSY